MYMCQIHSDNSSPNIEAAIVLLILTMDEMTVCNVKESFVVMSQHGEHVSFSYLQINIIF